MPPAPLKVSSSSKTEALKESNASTSVEESDISSPHELTAFVENILGQIESKFDDMSSQILERMNAMSTRVDSLEAAIQDLINGDVPQAQPQTPQLTGPGR